MNPIDCLRDPRLLGALSAFRDLATWRAWLVFVAVVYGVTLSSLEAVGLAEDDALAIFRQHTGRRTPREGGYAEACAITGVQSGKTTVAGVLVDHAALTSPPGTYAALIGQDLRGAMRVILRAARLPFETVPAFQAEVARATQDEVELRSGSTLAVWPCRPAALRGIRASIVVLDEMAFYRSTNGNPVDVEMLRVARGRVATTNGRIVILSSPYAATGALHDLHRRHYGRDDSPTLMWQASAPAMNPTLSADYLQRMQVEDPEAYRSEVLGEFRAGISTFLDPDVLDTAIDRGVRERLPEPHCWRYQGFVDAASGSGKDCFAVGVAHRDEHGRAVLDVVRAWRPPFNPSGVLSEACALLRSYRVTTVHGDRYAPGFVAEGFRVGGVMYVASERDTSSTYLELLPHLNAGRVVLLDDAELLRELRGLERRRGTSGRDRIDHRPGAHDDRAVAASGALVRCAAPVNVLEGRVTWGDDEDRPDPRNDGAPWAGRTGLDARLALRDFLIRNGQYGGGY